MLLTKEQILGANDVRQEDVEVPEWGGAVRIRSMTGADRDDYEQWLISQAGAGGKAAIRNLRARLVSLSIVGENGERLFGDGEIEALGAKSAAALDRVFARTQALNAIGQKEFDDLVKPSAPAPGADSGSGSPATSA